jgi:hypothetical protein
MFAAPHNIVDDLNARKQMFKIVEHQQHLFVLQVIQQLHDRFCRSEKAQVEHCGDFDSNRFSQVVVIWIEVCQFNQPDTIRIMAETIAGDGGGQACLTHAAQPDDRDQPTPRLIEAHVKPMLGGSSPEELIVGCGQVVTSGGDRA